MGSGHLPKAKRLPVNPLGAKKVYTADMARSTFSFATRLTSLPISAVAIPGNLADSKAKKRARVAVSASRSTDTLGFLHATLLKIGRAHYLLAGPSGIGKSTYAYELGQRARADVLANDWVAVEREGSRFYASDLNYPADIRHADRCPLTGIIFLTQNDTLERDAFAPNDQEWEALLYETFDTVSPDERAALSRFWTGCKDILPLCGAVSARRHPIGQTAALLCGLLQRPRTIRRPGSRSVGVIGTGAVGSTLAFQLGTLPYVRTVHLFNRTPAVATGNALDMNHATAFHRTGDVFIAHDDAAEVFRHASSVFLTFRDESTTLAADVPERWRKVAGHLAIIRRYARLASSLRFTGTIFVVTNPVDILTYACYASSEDSGGRLYSHQIYGIGLETDAARAVTYGRRLNPAFSQKDFVLYGNHSDEFILEATLPAGQLTDLQERVKGASAEVRQFVPRTVYGPVDAAVRTYDAFVRNTSAHATLIQEGAFIGRNVRFRHGLPQLSQAAQGDSYARILEQNRQAVAACMDIL